MATLVFPTEAREQFADIPQSMQMRVYKLIERLKAWPEVSGAKPLSGNLAGHYRLRTGDYRLQFRVEGDRVVIEKRIGSMIEKTRVETITIKGERFVLVPESDYSRLLGETLSPELPPADSQGYYPALETMRAIMAQGIIKRRWQLGLTQAELARRAGIRPETLNRIERAVRAPSVATMDRIDAALKEAEGEEPWN